MAGAGQVEDQGRQVGQGRSLVAAESPRAPVDLPTRRARRGLAGQPPPLSGVPAEGGAAPALPPRRPRARSRAPRRLACLGFALETAIVRPPRPHDPQAPRWDPRRDPPRSLERKARGAQLEGPADQPSQLRLSRRGSVDRTRLSLLRRDHCRPPAAVSLPLKRPEHPKSSPTGRPRK